MFRGLYGEVMCVMVEGVAEERWLFHSAEKEGEGERDGREPKIHTLQCHALNGLLPLTRPPCPHQWIRSLMELEPS